MIVLSVQGLPAWADAPEQEQLDTVEVVADSPVSQDGVPINNIPAHVQTISATQLDQAQSTSLAEYMNRYLGGVVVNDAQNNPLQPDVQFRGFTASPLLGLPQGLAVYVNGVRFNEMFGDTVNWDLVPEGAVEQMALHSGSNAVYGLNAIGGAISMRTKTGFTAPKHELEVSGGAWGRHTEELRSGWNNGNFAYFVDIKHFQEDGWRAFSPSDAKQGFGTLSWRGEQSALNLNLAATDNALLGNGALPIQLAKQDYKAIYTHSDQTVNRLFLASLDGNTWLTDRIELSGNIYYRQNRTHTFNGDDSGYQVCDPGGADAGMLCEETAGAETVVTDVNGNPVVGDDASASATANTNYSYQRAFGGTLQAAFNQDVFNLANRFVLGAGYDRGRTHFGSDTELGALTADRGVARSGILVDESRVRLHTRTTHYGLYLTDTLHLTEQLAVSAGGRYNWSFMKLGDRYGQELDGNHRFERFNPTAGLTYEFAPEVTAYGGYSEATRAPTAMELSCADPLAPCKLPNAFVSDPPLKQVVANSWEAGLRGDLDRRLGGGNRLHWNAGFFRTLNQNDIIFISSGNLTNQGYFSNVGNTLRQGYELGLNGQLWERWRFSANYTFLDATFQSGFLASSPNNPRAAADGSIQVSKGDRIPALPRHSLKLGSDVDLWHDVTVGADMQLSTSRVFRGDEANLNGKLGGFAVFNLHGEYRVHKNITLFGRIDNLFDRQYKNFGLYGDASDVLGASYNDQRFVGVGAPRAGWVGIRLSL
ncbi:MAG: TonB-dependent receptor [Methylococcaceae bacterium]|nr:MAG: TonB-dependent receptor [Methylococcaceae bacterium]